MQNKRKIADYMQMRATPTLKITKLYNQVSHTLWNPIGPDCHCPKHTQAFADASLYLVHFILKTLVSLLKDFTNLSFALLYSVLYPTLICFRFLNGTDTREIRQVSLTCVNMHELREKNVQSASWYYGHGHVFACLSLAELHSETMDKYSGISSSSICLLWHRGHTTMLVIKRSIVRMCV